MRSARFGRWCCVLSFLRLQCGRSRFRRQLQLHQIKTATSPTPAAKDLKTVSVIESSPYYGTNTIVGAVRGQHVVFAN
jgi:hypothetical protein